jgi:hypothetical protein
MQETVGKGAGMVDAERSCSLFVQRMGDESTTS